MSLIKFEVTEDHIKLIKHLKWNTLQFPHITHQVNFNTPFSDGERIVYDIGLILHGYDGKEVQPDTEQDPLYGEDEINRMKKLYEELPMALDIICFFGEFATGKFKTKSYVRDWKKIETNTK
jgi:hypothetical protein